MDDSEPYAQFAAHRSKEGIIADRLGFHQMDGESGFGRTQGPDVQMMEIGNAR